MSSPNEAPVAPSRKNKSTLLASVPLETAPAVAPPQKAGGAGKVIASLVVLGLLGGAYFATQSSDSTDGTQTAAAIPERAIRTATTGGATTAADPSDDAVEEAAVESSEPVVAEAASEPAEPAAETAAEIAADVPEMDIIQPLAGAPACENAIYTNLASLQRASGTGGTWASHQSQVTNLVQNVINCDGTTFDVVGSFDTLNNGQSDLSVLWDASSKHLLLEMIPAESATTAIAESGDALFVLR